MFIALLTDLADGSSHTIHVCLTNLKSEIQYVFITLHPNEYIQEFHYYPFPVK